MSTEAIASLSEASLSTVALITTTFVLSIALAYRKFTEKEYENLPPHIPSSIPFLGQAVTFSKDPVGFLLAAYKQYGPVFSFTMVGKTFTYLIGSDASALFFNSKNENLNAEDVYGHLITPVFGKGVAYDCPNPIFLEQKKMFKTGLNIARFRQHVPMIEEETIDYFKRWGDSGEKNIFSALSELIILTASRCLHGKEVRAIVDEKIAQLYWDLDGGLTPAAWLLPGWLPIPSFKKRDRAHIKLKEMFHMVIQKRRESEPEDDMLQTLIETPYKSGRNLTDDEVSGMLIGLLMAGQHTSSTTGAWLSFFLAQNKDIQDMVLEEQHRLRGSEWDPVSYDILKESQILDKCIKETLRLRPPLMSMMRLCKTPQKVMNYTIPPGHQVCVSPPTSHRLPDKWQESEKFDVKRYSDPKSPANTDKFTYIPFGAGRHRCIGESFAYVQIKTIMATLIKMYEFELINDTFPEVDLSLMIHCPKNAIIRYKRRQLS